MSPRWLYLALAAGAGIGAAVTARPHPDPAPVNGSVVVPFELNGERAGSCDVRVSGGVVDLLACEVEGTDDD